MAKKAKNKLAAMARDMMACNMRLVAENIEAMTGDDCDPIREAIDNVEAQLAGLQVLLDECEMGGT